MNPRIRVSMWLVVAFISCVGGRPSLAQNPNKTSAEQFKNIQVLGQMPADQMGKVMNIMSQALGVSCQHCHDGYDFAKEGVAKKDAARAMLTMTDRLNQEHYGGRAVISCVTCHQGQAVPIDATQSATTMAEPNSPDQPFGANPPAVVTTKSATARTATEILQRYQQAIRLGQPAADGLRKWRGVRLEPNGDKEPEETIIEADKSWKQITRYGSLEIIETYSEGQANKQSGAKAIPLKADEAEQIRIEATLALGQPLDQLFPKWTVGTAVVIEEREMAVLQATQHQDLHRFYFDVETGLLRRRTSSVPTVLGAYVIQVDYGQYEPVAGLQRPKLATFQMPGIRWQRQITTSSDPSRR